MPETSEIRLGTGYGEPLQAAVNFVIKEHGGFTEHVLDDLNFLEVDVHLFGDVFRLEFDVHSGAVAKGDIKTITRFANEVFHRLKDMPGG